MNRPQTQHRSTAADQGSAAVELVLATPLVVLVLLTVVALGRLTDARLIVADAAHQAARAASLARTDTDAQADAQHIANTTLTDAHSTCTHPYVTIDTDGLTPGSSTAATVTCTADLGDLTHLGMPGTVTITGTAHSPVDRFRSSP
ncbi:TadE/TadG family type IV pilus assembly protein [Streptomyces chengbuensis]|uniref:TadE/TadG family type IV pilus assembly protein n=1 Tax=Streptomyces chengbuensis TaxID=3053466 RepID=UPI0025B608F6|nr:TadE/TadG family type IV pilus assembly protein [Streptomyces sp. HUAS CB01]WJY53540.1 TadE/TadG family type IV pilus assembly protein [Streptomyces sp. HUAS CB01]